MTSNTSVRFSKEDLEIFSRASGDRNPLHLSADYALRTAYGQQVVFGALGCIACLGAVPKSSGTVKRVVADFQRPMFLDVDYRLESTESRDGMVIRLFDGSTPVITTTVKFSPDEVPFSTLGSKKAFPLTVARVIRWVELGAGLEAEGSYRADTDAVAQLSVRWALELDPLVMEAFLWSSYFVGMELPGENALFFRAALDFSSVVNSDTPLHFKAKVANLNQSLAQIRTSIELRSEQHTAVCGQLTAFVRPEMPAFDFSEGEGDRGASAGLANKVAVVIGASRGLGAALAMAFAADGAEVIAVSRSAASWSSNLPGIVRARVTFWEGDASDAAALGRLAGEIIEKFGRMDFLVCSAFPAIPSLRMEPGAAERIQNYLTRATNLVLRPLCAFLPQLSRNGGCTVLISSVAVDQPVREWPHYVAAKSAAESFCRIAPMQFPETSSLIVRPEKLLTEMTNTPLGRKGATSPLTLARQISRSMQNPPRAGTCQVLDLKTSTLPSTLGFGQTETVEASIT